MFEWDDANADHIARHGVQPEEAEEAVLDSRRVARQAYTVADERRSAILGAAQGGRLLFVVFVRRGGRIRVVSARDANALEKRVYRKRRK